MDLFYGTDSWYSDLFDVYRNTEVTINSIQDINYILVSSNNFGRVYQKNNSKLNIENQSSKIVGDDMLACNIDIDIIPGDRIEVIRNGRNIQNVDTKLSTKYIVGESINYYEMVGGVNTTLEHKQVPLFYERRT